MSGRLTTDVDKRLLRTTKFPAEFNVKVDMTKVNIPVIKKWVSDEIARILGSDDDVVTDTIFNLIEGTKYVCTASHIPPKPHD
jgi:serine/arginine repetitive matrix protein 1